MILPKVICITGGMGSGKSTFCAMLEAKGQSVYYSDNRAKLLMNSDVKLVDAITNLMGKAAYEGGSLNRSYIADRIFNNQILKHKFESLVHPVVRADFERWAMLCGKNVVFKESALVLEAKDKTCEFIVSLVADEDVRIERVKMRNPDLKEQHIKERLSTQYKDDYRRKHSHLVVVNNGTLSDLEVKVDYLLSKVI